MKIVLASGNANKYAEMKDALSPVGIELIFGKELQPKLNVEETGLTYAENSLLKARAWSEATGLAAMADDSGLEVMALGGLPGIRSARIVEGNDADRINWLLEQLKDKEDRSARFVACLTVVFTGNANPLVVTGYCDGRIIDTPRGSCGFGYDPVFVPNGYDKTFAELGANIKDKISHRAKALATMRQLFARFNHAQRSGGITIIRVGEE